MPAKSQKQRAYLNWRFGHSWVVKHGFDNRGKLPTYANEKHDKPTRRKKKKRKKGE